MTPDNNTPISMTKAQVAHYYKISQYILRQWLKDYENEIGEYKAMYTPAQVKIIKEKLEGLEPGN